MVPLRAAHVLPCLRTLHRAATAIDRIAPFPRRSVSLHTGRGGAPEASELRVVCPGDEALNDGDD